MAVRVAVVGTCASGKTSVTEALKALDFDAWAVAQEHSVIADLWNHQQPDRLVYLANSLDTIRRRRNDDRWPAWIYETQLERLAPARASADVVVDTDDLDLDAVVSRIVAFLGQLR
jgi:gluconate kinase